MNEKNYSVNQKHKEVGCNPFSALEWEMIKSGMHLAL